MQETKGPKKIHVTAAGEGVTLGRGANDANRDGRSPGALRAQRWKRETSLATPALLSFSVLRGQRGRRKRFLRTRAAVSKGAQRDGSSMAGAAALRVSRLTDVSCAYSLLSTLISAIQATGFL